MECATSALGQPAVKSIAANVFSPLVFVLHYSWSVTNIFTGEYRDGHDIVHSNHKHPFFSVLVVVES